MKKPGTTLLSPAMLLTLLLTACAPSAPAEPEAVRANLEHQRQNPNAQFMRGLSQIEEITVVDEHTITLSYAEPYFATISDFYYPDVMAMASPATIEEGSYQMLTGSVGTGPYVYSELQKGAQTTLIKYEDFVGEAPYWDEIIIKYIPDAGARLMALQTGEIDLLFGAALMTYDEYQQASMLPGMATGALYIPKTCRFGVPQSACTMPITPNIPSPRLGMKMEGIS